MFTRWIYTVLLIVVLVSLVTAGVRANDESKVICGDLAESDCQILKDNLTAMESVGSVTFSMSLTMDAEQEGMLDEASGMNMSLGAQGSMSIDPTILAGIVQLEDQLEESLDSLLSEDTFALLDSLVGGLAGDVSINLHMVADDEITNIAMHVLMKDGIFVLDAGALAELMGEPMQGVDWIGLDANGLMTLLASDPDMSEALGSLDDMQTDVDNMKDIEEAVTTITRLADSEINGVAVAVFESSVDMGLLTDLVMELADPQGAMDPAEGAMYRQQLADTDLTMWQYIGLSDHYTYRTAISMDMGSGDVEDDGGSMRGTAMSMSMTIDQSNFNEPVEVEIPEDAFVMPLAFLMQMGN